MSEIDMNDDAITACADLVGRSGASHFEIGHDGEDDTPPDRVRWYAFATYRGARIQVEGYPTSTGAAMGLAERLLRGATCRCGKLVSMSDRRPGCRWRLLGPAWTPGCDAPPVTVAGRPGDYAAMRQAMANRVAQQQGRGRQGRRR